MNLPAPVQGTHRLFSGQATGLGVQLPDWKYPVVCELPSGQLKYDNFNERWGKQNRTFIVVLAPVVQIPVELEHQFVVIEHDLPGREQLEEIARGIATEDGELPNGDDLSMVLDAAAGLTRAEAEGAFSLSLVRDGQIRPQAIWDLKCQSLKKSGLVSLHRGSETFDQLGGLDALKSFCSRIMRNQGHGNPLKRPRGVLLLSPPGCGKSQFAKALGNEMGRPTLILDIGALMGSLARPSPTSGRP